MIKSDLVKLISDKCEAEELQVKVIVDGVFTAIANELLDGGKVVINGFGSFGTKLRSARPVNDLKNGGRVITPAAIVPYFKPAENFKNAIKNALTVSPQE